MRRWAIFGQLLAAALATVATACGGGREGPPPLRQNSMSYGFIVKPDDSPPHARQDIIYTIQIVDKKTRQPIQNGEGQLYANKPIEESAPTGPQSRTWDGFAASPEVGTYRAKLNFVVAGLWAVGLRFRRDTLQPFEKIEWLQVVLDERPSKTP